MKTKLLCICLLSLLSSSIFAQNDAWSKTTFKDGTDGVSLENFDIKQISVLALDIESFKQQLIGAPLRGALNGVSNTIVNFPSVDGKQQQYRVVETVIFSSEDNTAQHANIKTYLGFRTDNSGTRVRFSVTPLGLKGMISEPGKETVFIQPITKVSNGQYMVYNRTAQINRTNTFECLTEAEEVSRRIISSETARDANDQLLRTYRIAVSVTSEYTGFWDDGNAANGDDRADALAQLVSTLNRNNEVYEVDMAITFVLVDTADDPALDLIYSGTDPYSANLNGDLQTNLTATVGEADYDIGHLLHFAGNNGNAGCIGCVCENGKGSAFSAHSFVDNNGGPYMADFFDIDYVPHEIGHQMGANHTFSNNVEGTGVNSEPGSGTTIMGYAGITGPNNVQNHSDPYFHYQSINQILNTVTTGANQCAATSSITNNPPVANAGADFAIPNGTAFILKATATDPDGGDTLTYTWEQIDSGQTTNTQFGPTHLGPVWRSRPPSTSGDRFMPIYNKVLAGTLTETNPAITADNSSWETISTVARTLNFGLTVRDRSEAGGVGQMPQTDFDTMVVTVEGGAPFTVVTPPAWGSGSTQTLSWNVGATNTAPINCQTVNIKFSTDSGATFPTILASGVANDGSETITVPSVADTNTARILIEADDNIFYALSEVFPISNAPSFTINSINGNQSACNIDAVSYEIDFLTVNGFNEPTTFSVAGNPAGSTVAFTPATINADGQTTMNITGLTGVTVGDYTITVTATSASQTKTIDLTLLVTNGICASAAETTIVDRITGVIFNTINNIDTASSTIPYEDFTAITTDVEKNANYDISVNVDTDGAFDYFIKVWIDWNQNCILEESEKYDLGTAVNLVDQPTSASPFTITVPNDAITGTTTMRVIMKNATTDNLVPCDNGFYGQTEDYSVNIMPLLSVDEFGISADFSVYPNPNNGSFNVKLNSTSNNDIKISVFDIRGRQVFNNNYKASTEFDETINLDNVQSGMYMLQVSDGVNTQTKKVIVN